ncbi:MAG: Acetylornithine deacetylase [Planctomycetota bacterium]|jgi:acetylornithine deacetylase
MTQASCSESVSDILCRLIEIPSVNPMGRSVSGPEFFEGRVSDWLMSFFGSFGANSERIQVLPGRDNVLARYDAGEDRPTLLWDAHQDTVPVEGMTIDPFLPKLEQGRIYGRGSCDVKGGLAAMLYAFRRLCLERPPNAPNVVLSCSCDEESTALGIAHVVRYWTASESASRLLPKKPDGAIVAEPTELDIVVAHRGVTRFKIHTHGKACHSSDPTKGVNAIYRMAQVLSHLEQYAESLRQTTIPHPLCGGATLSVGRIEGGISVNVVPDHCYIEIDRRIIPGEDPLFARRQIEEFLRSRVDFDLDFEAPWIECVALSDADNSWLASGLLSAMRQWDEELRCGGDLPMCGERKVMGVAYGTNASTLCEAGVPSVVFGPGSIAQAHTKDEYIDQSSLEKAAEVYYRLCCENSWFH